jgi:DNA-binding PadR family transcriptional regulator
MYTGPVVLELAILGLLKEQELHGYELKRRLVENLGLASGVSFGSLYPALSRLETAGAVKAVESRSPAGSRTVPHTGSLGGELATLRARKPAAPRAGRARKVYGITERGEALFEELLAAETQASDDGRVFSLRLAFARYLPLDARIGMLERRRAHLVERLIQLRTRVKGARDGYARSLVEHDREAAEHDLTWIERLIAAERAAPHPDGAAPAEPAPDGAPTDIAPAPRRRTGFDRPTISGLRPSPQPHRPEEDTKP